MEAGGIAENYRPVALNRHIVKVFERVLRKALVNYLEEKNLLPEGQHGFCSMRSALIQLLTYWDTIFGGLEEGKGVNIIYTDFRKKHFFWKIRIFWENYRESSQSLSSTHPLHLFLGHSVNLCLCFYAPV